MWRTETANNILTALWNNPDWLVLTLEVFGAVYIFRLVVGIRRRIREAGETMAMILVFLAFCGIVYVLWNYLYIDGVNPFTGATQQ